MLASVPLLWISTPPVMDYPNHLVRIWLIAGGAGQAPLDAVYLVDWSQASTNIAVDWVFAHLAHLLPFPVVDRLLRVAMFLGPPVGAICLGRAIFGRLTAWSLAPLALIWGTTSVAGFVNYSISLGMALLFAAAQLRLRRLAPPTLALHAAFAVALLLVHPFGLLFYLALLAGIVIGRELPDLRDRGQVVRMVGHTAVLSLIGLAPLVAMMAMSDAAPSAGTIVHRGLAQLHPEALLRTFLSPISSYDLRVDVALLLPLALAAGIVALKRGWAFHFGLVVVAALLLLLAALAPNEIGDAAWIDRRFPLMAALTLAAALQPVAPGPRLRAFMAAALVVAVVGKAGWITHVWAQREQDVADLAAATATLEPGDAVMVVKTRVTDDRSVPLGRLMADTANPVRAHLPTMLIKDRRALIPTLFAIRGQQPIRVVGLPRSPERGMSSFVPYASVVGSPDEQGHIPGWRCAFRYLLLLGADEQPSEPLDTRGLTLVGAQGFAALYAIDRPSPGEGCS
jgi:hypothetical protein